MAEDAVLPGAGGDDNGDGGSRHRLRQGRFAATLRTRIAQEMRERILTGQLAAGSTLGLDELADYYGASRTPVREALIELEHDGLVQITPRAGVTVVGAGPRELLDNFSLFATLSGVAAQWAAERMSAVQLDHIRACNRDVEAAAGGHHHEMVRANWRFHRAVNQASQSTRLCSLLRRACRVVPVRFFELVPHQTEITLDEHAALLAAFAAREGATARRLAEAHIAGAGEMLAARLSGRATEEGS